MMLIMFPRAASNLKKIDLKFSKGCEEVEVAESNSGCNFSQSEYDDGEGTSTVTAAFREIYSL